MHLIVRRNALLLERKERKNQSILKVDFSNAINKIKLESRKESYSRGEDITQVYNIIYKLDFSIILTRIFSDIKMRENIAINKKCRYMALHIFFKAIK